MGTVSSRQGDAGRAAAREHTKRCRERRRLMRETVRLRRQLAASHAGYLRSLGLVASTLTRFAVGEPLPVSDHTPPTVLVHRQVPVPSSPPPLLRSIEQQRPGQQEEDEAAAVGEAAPFGATRTDGVGGGEELRTVVRHRSLAEVAAGLEEDGAAAVGEAAPFGATRTDGVGGGEELRTVVRHRSLAEVAAGLEEYFIKVSAAGDAVSSLLEASNAEFKGGSNSFLGALCCLSAPSAAHDRLDSMHGERRHSATLQQLMAWEKKLYREVKERERLQIRHDKKLAELRDQEYSRKINVDIQKLKAAWDRASAQLAAASLAVDTSSAAIAELRDTHLARQVLGLCHATLDMWKATQQHHEAQCLIAQQLRGLSSRTSTDPTTEIHHEATRALEAAMAAWSAALGHVAKHQRDYVHALHGWLKLTLTPINGVEASSSSVAVEFTAFVDRWRQVLDRVHCVDVLKSIKSFASATRALYALQSDELRVARRVRQYSRELDRKSRMLGQVERSYYDSYVPMGISLWHRGRHDDRQVHDARIEVVRRKEEIAVCRRMLEDEMRRHAKAIDATRSTAGTGVQGTLPAVFQAMAAFSASLANALEAVCRHGTHVQ